MAMMSSSSLFAAAPSSNCRSVSQPQLRLSASPFNGPSLFVRLPPPSKLTVCSASTSSPPPPPPAVDEEPFSPPPSQSDSPLDSGDGALFSGSGCKACGKAEIERGCNGEGRIQGGIATVPGFGWWPIKAYRPCPGFVASGGRYFRRGQSMDEVAFGRGGPATYSDSEDEAEPSKKRSNPRRFKR